MHKRIHSTLSALSVCVCGRYSGNAGSKEECLRRMPLHVLCSPSIYEWMRLAHCVLVAPLFLLLFNVVSSWCCACGRRVVVGDVHVVR